MLIDDIDIDLYIIDGDPIAKVTSSDTHWLRLKPTEAGCKVFNENKQTSYYVLINIINNKAKPVNCGCEYNIFNDHDVCKHRLVVGKFINANYEDIKIINSISEE